MTITVTKSLSKKRVNLERIKHLSSAHLHGRKVYICPRCKKRVPYKSRHCPFCGEKYPFAVKVPSRLLKGCFNGIASQVLHDYVHTYLFPHFSGLEQNYLNQYFTIAIAQNQGTSGSVANARGTTTGSSITVTLYATPISGNVLILCYGSYSSAYVTISSITQTGVTWAGEGNPQAQKEYSTNKQDTEIWIGIVGSGASKTITVTLSGSAAYGAVADVCEWSGIATSSFLDTTATAGGANLGAPSTGTTATTAQASELWIGSIFTTSSSDITQSSPTNSFSLLDGLGQKVYAYAYIAEAYLYHIASGTGVASTATTSLASGTYVGCIATFKAAAPPPSGGVLAQVM
jgi:hypothetical protein